MPNNNTPAFQRRQEEQRQQQRSAAAQAAQARVQAHRERATTSILDQIRPLQEQHNQDWAWINSELPYGESITHISGTGQARNVDPRSPEAARLQDTPHWTAANNWGRSGGVITSGADLDTDAARMFHNPAHYTAGMDPIGLNSPGSGGSSFTLTTGARGHAELDRAIQERITQERARPTPSYDIESTVARYGHLLTALDQQRLGYVAPEVTYEDYRRVSAAFMQEDADRHSQPLTPSEAFVRAPVDGQQYHTMSYPGVRLRDTSRSNRVKETPQPVANFLAPPPGPTAQELATADEWLKSSPWG